MTLAFGAECREAQKTPPPGIREYKRKPKPAGAVTRVARTLFRMLDGGAANCCKADTADAGVKGKDAAGGAAKTRQIRACVFDEYGWIDKDWRPVPWPGSFSHFVSGEPIAEVVALLIAHGAARGSGTVARMQCLADGEPALEDALREAFPNAVFANGFPHALEHLHACCRALGPGSDEAETEYQTCRKLLLKTGASDVAERLRRLHAARLDESIEASKELRYLAKRADNMSYGWLRENGYCIGSGHVEAAVRVLIVRRCKQAGMHWSHQNAINVAAFHAHCRSHRSAA